MTRPEDAFIMGLKKIGAGPPTYPISRFLTNALAAQLPGAAAGGFLSLPGGHLLSSAAGGLLTGGASALGRKIHAKGLLGRVRKGGKGLFGHEKTQLAETLEMSPTELDETLKRLSAKAQEQKLSTHPISRLLTHPAAISPIWSRLIGSRAMAGRAMKERKEFFTKERLSPLERGLLRELHENRPPPPPVAKPSFFRSIMDALKRKISGTKKKLIG